MTFLNSAATRDTLAERHAMHAISFVLGFNNATSEIAFPCNGLLVIYITCGSGTVTILFARQGTQIAAFEISEPLHLFHRPFSLLPISMQLSAPGDLDDLPLGSMGASPMLAVLFVPSRWRDHAHPKASKERMVHD